MSRKYKQNINNSVALFQLCEGGNVSEYKLVFWAAMLFLFGQGIFRREIVAFVYWILASDLLYAGTGYANSVIQIMRHVSTQ